MLDCQVCRSSEDTPTCLATCFDLRSMPVFHLTFDSSELRLNSPRRGVRDAPPPKSACLQFMAGDLPWKMTWPPEPPVRRKKELDWTV